MYACYRRHCLEIDVQGTQLDHSHPCDKIPSQVNLEAAVFTVININACGVPTIERDMALVPGMSF
jgi:hypothetical protein